jgi:hypothetical protein
MAPSQDTNNGGETRVQVKTLTPNRGRQCLDYMPTNKEDVWLDIGFRAQNGVIVPSTGVSKGKASTEIEWL